MDVLSLAVLRQYATAEYLHFYETFRHFLPLDDSTTWRAIIFRPKNHGCRSLSTSFSWLCHLRLPHCGLLSDGNDYQTIRQDMTRLEESERDMNCAKTDDKRSASRKRFNNEKSPLIHCIDSQMDWRVNGLKDRINVIRIAPL